MTTKRESAEIIVMPSADQATTKAAELFKQTICNAVSERQMCNIALAGGTTPHDLYQKLAADVEPEVGMQIPVFVECRIRDVQS